MGNPNGGYRLTEKRWFTRPSIGDPYIQECWKNGHGRGSYRMTTVQQLLDAKSQNLYCAHPDDMVLDALKIMDKEEIGSVLIKEDEKLVGIFTERHYARKVFLKGRSSPKTPIRAVMKKSVICVTPEQTIEACMAIMTEKRILHLPVMRDEQLVGVISIGDIVKSIISEQQFTIEQLEHYISG